MSVVKLSEHSVRGYLMRASLPKRERGDQGVCDACETWLTCVVTTYIKAGNTGFSPGYFPPLRLKTTPIVKKMSLRSSQKVPSVT